MKNEIYRKRPIVNMYVLSIQDIQRIENCTYSQAVKIFGTMNSFHINRRPYVLAQEYFCTNFDIDEIAFCQPLGEGLDTKVIKLLPPVLNVEDIEVIFNCGSKRAYQIMVAIPKTFKINNNRYIKSDDFKEWLNTLPNKTIIVG